MPEAYPLCWPESWKRMPRDQRKRAQFGSSSSRYDSASGQTFYLGKKTLSVSDSVSRIQKQLRQLGVESGEAIISTNVQVRLDGLPYSNRAEPSDPGAAVYWRIGNKQQCMAIDRYDRVADNLAAIAATLEALRAIERHGGGEILERAFRGFAQLPASTSKPWRDVLGFANFSNPFITAAEIEERFRELAHQRHSDKGGDDDRMRELIEARVAARRELGV